MTNMSIQPLWFTHFIEILLVLEFQLTKFIVGALSYKAHFRPQISSNEPFDHQVIEGLDKMSNLFSFEEYPEDMKEEMVEVDKDKRHKLALTVQMSVNFGVINKMNISETGCMDMDEET